jgi:hypothetical protein
MCASNPNTLTYYQARGEPNVDRSIDNKRIPAELINMQIRLVGVELDTGL